MRLWKIEKHSRRRSINLIVLSVTVIATCYLSLWAKPDDAVPYPVGYRQWTHVKSTLIGPKSPAYDKIGG